MVKKITRTALLPYSAQQVFDIVNNVNAYSEFLPWCGDSEAVYQNSLEMVASVTIAKAGIRQTFKTRNHLVLNERIEMQLIEGSFRALKGLWCFKVLEVNACKIRFEVEFEMSHGVLNAAIGTIFEHIASTMVDSFCERCRQVYD